jgi:ABC-2 type transport system permease protein
MILLHLQHELLKLFARKRTYIGFAAFLGVEILILFLLQLERVQSSISRIIERNGYVAEYYLSGLTLALLILLWTVLLLGGLYLALVSGDMVAKEVEDGTMRMALCRPVSRVYLVLIKYAACSFYTLVLVLFISITALLAGFLQSGTGGLFVFAPTEGIFALYDGREGILRYSTAIPLLAFSLLTVTSIGLFLSCLPMKPAAATILTLSFLFVDLIMRGIPYFEGIRGWFLTSKMNAWVYVFQPNIPWEKMIEDYAWLFAINSTLVIAGILFFQQRDLKS